MLSKDLERALNESFKQARAQRHEFITVEHLLLALLDDPAALKVLSACSANVEALRGDLAEFIDATRGPRSHFTQRVCVVRIVRQIDQFIGIVFQIVQELSIVMIDVANVFEVLVSQAFKCGDSIPNCEMLVE